jgi:hypothetical protein
MSWPVELSSRGFIILLYEYRHIGCGARKADEVRIAKGSANFGWATPSSACVEHCFIDPGEGI